MAAKDIKILLVDDDTELLASVSDIFRLFGYSVQTAISGNQAWGIIKENPVDLVISDVRMEDGTGIELLEKCKQQNRLTPRVLLVTGYQDYTLAEYYQMGVDGFFEKPFDASAVRAAIKDCMLELSVLWATNREPHVDHHIHLDTSLEQAVDNGSLQFGRRGFFMRTSADSQYSVGEVVCIDLKHKGTSELKSYGTIVWAREEDTGTEDAGIGVKIQYVEDGSRDSFIEWINAKEFRAIIPFGIKK